MKLDRANFSKEQIGNDLYYYYKCQGMTFVMKVYYDSGRKIDVYQLGDDGNAVNPTSFDNNQDAWNHFEQLVDACSPQQQSAGGFKNNPTNNPKILPLLAITNNGSGNKMDVVVFVSEINSGEQVRLFDFQIDYDPEIKNQSSSFVVDWKNQEVPDILKSDVIMRFMDDIVLLDGNGKEMVFVFAPVNISSQGGNENEGEGEG